MICDNRFISQLHKNILNSVLFLELPIINKLKTGLRSEYVIAAIWAGSVVYRE